MSEMKRAYQQTADAVEQFRRGITETCRADNYKTFADMLQRKALQHMDGALHDILDALCMDDAHDADVWAALLNTETSVDDMVARLFDMKAGVR
jgi:hypothetical protein